MNITVENCLSLPSFKDAKLLTSGNFKDKCIKKVSVLEAHTSEDINEERTGLGLLLITGFFSVRDDAEAQCKLIERLKDTGVSALVVNRVGEIVKKIDRSVIEACEKAEIELIAVDAQSAVAKSDMIDEVSKLLFYGNSLDVSNNLMINSTFELLNFSKHENFEMAIRAAAIENNFQFVLFSKEFNPVLIVETQQNTTIERAVMIAREISVEARKVGYTTCEVDGIHMYWGIMEVKDDPYYILIVDNNNAYSVEEMMKLADLIKVSMGIWAYVPTHDKTSDFIRSLQRGYSKKAHFLCRDLDIKESEILSVFLIKEWEEGESQSIMYRYCETLGIKSYRFVDKTNVYGILVGKYKEGICTDLYRLLRANTKSIVAHVTGIGGIQSAIDSFELINDVMTYAEIVFSKKRTLSKYDLTFVRTARKLQVNAGAIKKNYMDLLEPLEQNSGAKAQGLIDTLEIFMLDSDMNMKKTADIMDVHSNTVQYRLKKINSILGAEVLANRVTPCITMALAIKRLENI